MGQHGLKSQGTLSPVFLSRMDRCIQASTYRKAYCLLCCWPKDQMGVDILAGGRRIDRWEGSLRQTSSHTRKSGRASLAVVFTRLPMCLHTLSSCRRVLSIGWLKAIVCCWFPSGKLRQTARAPPLFLGPNHPHSQPSYRFPFCVRPQSQDSTLFHCSMCLIVVLRRLLLASDR